LLGYLIQLAEGRINLLDAGALLFRRRRDIARDIGHSLHGRDDVIDSAACFLDEFRASVHSIYRGANQIFDFLGGGGAALGERTDLPGDNR
jgi:hypothetical protein